MTEPSGRRGEAPGDSWERRATDLASGVQRWLIKKSARSMRDELGGQVRKALRGEQRDPGDVWATATSEPPGALRDAPECAWCPVCRAARRIAVSRQEASGPGAVLSAADVVSGAVRDALAGLDSILSYRPSGTSSTGSSTGGSSTAESSTAESSTAGTTTADATREPADEPDHRS